jgi:alkylation response protein AidB-like acyl-CoA dehydrogenase
MDFQLSPEHQRLQAVCQKLARDFATRASAHDREASLPRENYDALRHEGLFGLTMPKELGGMGVGFLGYVLAAEELAQGCPATALTFNMHCAALGLIIDDPTVPDNVKRRAADLAVKDKRLIAATFSEPGTSSLIFSTYLPTLHARRVNGGYCLNGRKVFVSMIEAADYVYLVAHPAETTNPLASLGLLVSRSLPGQRVERVWNTLGMRATCSDTLVFEDCWIPEEAVCSETDHFFRWTQGSGQWAFGSYTSVYLGVGAAAYRQAVETLRNRVPKGFTQSLAYHPDVRRRVAEMSADLEAARLLMYHAAWLVDSEGDTPATTAALFRAKYVVGEAVARITRTALTICGAHALFKTAPLEQLFRDGASAPIMSPSSDSCLSNLGMLELGLDSQQMLPPLKRD